MEKTQYLEAIGRRKEAVARVRITPSSKQEVIINGKPILTYFPTEDLRARANEAFHKAALSQKFGVSAQIKGGGISAQAEAFRHGVTRALVAFQGDLRTPLKRLGFLKRDPRTKERRKFGLKKARKAPQWSKR